MQTYATLTVEEREQMISALLVSSNRKARKLGRRLRDVFADGEPKSDIDLIGPDDYELTDDLERTVDTIVDPTVR